MTEEEYCVFATLSNEAEPPNNYMRRVRMSQKEWEYIRVGYERLIDEMYYGKRGRASVQNEPTNGVAATEQQFEEKPEEELPLHEVFRQGYMKDPEDIEDKHFFDRLEKLGRDYEENRQSLAKAAADRHTLTRTLGKTLEALQNPKAAGEKLTTCLRCGLPLTPGGLCSRRNTGCDGRQGESRIEKELWTRLHGLEKLNDAVRGEQLAQAKDLQLEHAKAEALSRALVLLFQAIPEGTTLEIPKDTSELIQIEQEKWQRPAVQ